MCQKASTTSINGTPAPPISHPQQNHQTNKSKDFIQKHQKITRLDRLKGTVSAMEGELAIV